MELASLVRDILRQRHVERLAQHREQDNEAEAEWEIARWRQMGDDERRHFMHDILPARGWVPLQPVEE